MVRLIGGASRACKYWRRNVFSPGATSSLPSFRRRKFLITCFFSTLHDIQPNYLAFGIALIATRPDIQDWIFEVINAVCDGKILFCRIISLSQAFSGSLLSHLHSEGLEQIIKQKSCNSSRRRYVFTPPIAIIKSTHREPQFLQLATELECSHIILLVHQMNQRYIHIHDIRAMARSIVSHPAESPLRPLTEQRLMIF